MELVTSCRNEEEARVPDSLEISNVGAWKGGGAPQRWNMVQIIQKHRHVHVQRAQARLSQQEVLEKPGSNIESFPEKAQSSLLYGPSRSVGQRVIDGCRNSLRMQ